MGYCRMDSPMLILVSGEGSTDIGVASPGITGLCPPGSWEPGPMALWKNFLISPRWIAIVCGL